MIEPEVWVTCEWCKTWSISSFTFLPTVAESRAWYQQCSRRDSATDHAPPKRRGGPTSGPAEEPTEHAHQRSRHSDTGEVSDGGEFPGRQTSAEAGGGRAAGAPGRCDDAAGGGAPRPSPAAGRKSRSHHHAAARAGAGARRPRPAAARAAEDPAAGTRPSTGRRAPPTGRQRRPSHDITGRKPGGGVRGSPEPGEGGKRWAEEEASSRRGRPEETRSQSRQAAAGTDRTEKTLPEADPYRDQEGKSDLNQNLIQTETRKVPFRLV